MKGFDPLWSLVAALVYFEGPAGANVVSDEKTNGKVNLSNGAQISHLSPHFPNGALWISDQSAPSKLGLAEYSTSLFMGADCCIENQFVPTSWGVGGRRVLFHSANIVVYLLPDDTSIHLGVKFDGSSWVDIGHTIADPEAFLGVKHDFRARLSSLRISIELDGSEVASLTHDVTEFVSASQQFRFGNAFTSAPDQVFLGFIGQFRLTVSDLRNDVSGDPIQRFDVLGSLDPYREFVVAHSHFDAANNATEAEDTCGSSWVFDGSAKIKTSSAKFGVSSAYTIGGDVHRDGFSFADPKWCVEFWSMRDFNNGISYYIASIMDDAGVDHAVSICGPYFGPLTLRVAGVDVAVGSSSVLAPVSTFWHCAIVRDGDALAVFAAGSRALIYDLAGHQIESNGRLVLGKGGSVAPAGPSADWFDEVRVTIGNSRYNVSATSIDVPTERFNEYGPRSLSIEIVSDPDGLPLPGTLVRAYHRVSGRLVSQGITDADGKCLLAVSDASKHFWVAHHPTENALIFDHIIPVLV